MVVTGPSMRFLSGQGKVLTWSKFRHGIEQAHSFEGVISSVTWNSSEVASWFVTTTFSGPLPPLTFLGQSGF